MQQPTWPVSSCSSYVEWGSLIQTWTEHWAVALANFSTGRVFVGISASSMVMMTTPRAGGCRLNSRQIQDQSCMGESSGAQECYLIITCTLACFCRDHQNNSDSQSMAPDWFPNLFAIAIPFWFDRRLVSAHVLFDRDSPAFAMICLVRRLYDPDATSAL